MSDGSTAENDTPWVALAYVVRARRNELRLRQGDLEALGGPSEGTVRNMEHGARTNYSPRTIACLERALRFPAGTVYGLVEGTLNAEEALGCRRDDPDAGEDAQDIERREVYAHRLDRWAARLTVAALVADPADVAAVINEIRAEATALRRGSEREQS